MKLSLVPFIFMLIGVVMYYKSGPEFPKTEKIGLVLFAAGLLVVLLVAGSATVEIVKI
jgi:hypothetical protein